MRGTITALAALLLLAAPARAASYRIVSDDSSVLFTVRHMAGHVTGRFERFSGSFDFTAGQPELWKASATIEAASVNTTGATRDEHLRSADFLDAARCPAITFVSRKAARAAKGRYALLGDLTVRCVTRPVTLWLEPGPSGKDDRGEWRSFRATATLKRRDFGIVWDKPLNKLFIGDEVEASFEIQGVDPGNPGQAAR